MSSSGDKNCFLCLIGLPLLITLRYETSLIRLASPDSPPPPENTVEVSEERSVLY